MLFLVAHSRAFCTLVLSLTIAELLITVGNQSFSCYIVQIDISYSEVVAVGAYMLVDSGLPTQTTELDGVRPLLS